MPLGDLTTGQRRLLDAIQNGELGASFYLTGDTALSAFHLHHRNSEDLDLFCRDEFDRKPIVALINQVAEGEPLPRPVQHRLGFVVPVAGETVRIEFVHYPHESIEEPLPLHGRLRVDGLRDILANKLSAMVERTEGKDFADVFFLLHQPGLTLETGMDDCRRKFGWPGLEHLLQTAFLRCDRVKAWSRLEPELARETACEEFRKLAKSLVRLD